MLCASLDAKRLANKGMIILFPLLSHFWPRSYACPRSWPRRGGTKFSQYLCGLEGFWPLSQKSGVILYPDYGGVVAAPQGGNPRTPSQYSPCLETLTSAVQPSDCHRGKATAGIVIPLKFNRITLHSYRCHFFRSFRMGYLVSFRLFQTGYR